MQPKEVTEAPIYIMEAFHVKWDITNMHLLKMLVSLNPSTIETQDARRGSNLQHKAAL